MAMIGIDLGTTNSLACVWKDKQSVLIPNSFGEYLTPSVVSMDDDGSILVGKAARERLISHPQMSASAFKRFMGTRKIIDLGARTFYPEELSSFVLRRLKEDAELFLQETVDEAVISVPAYFNDNQRYATKVAAKLAGLQVNRLVNEPSAAALFSRLQKMEEDQCLLVFDFGGGTLDVSAVDCFMNVIEISAVAGDNRLGGEDFDKQLAHHFMAQNHMDYDSLELMEQRRLLKKAEALKIQLSSQESATMRHKFQDMELSLTMSQNDLIDIAASLFLRINKVIQRAVKDSGHVKSDFDDILLVGGSSKMPIVKGYLEHLFHKEPVAIVEPDTAVAHGVGVYTGIMTRQEEIQDIMMTDVCPFTLGVGTSYGKEQRESIIAVMIERNSVLPVSVKHRFGTLYDNQKVIGIPIYQGEEYYAKDNLKLGEINLPIPSAPAGVEAVDVRFTYDINGILEVEVVHEATNAKSKLVVVNENIEFDKDEIDRKLMELQKFKIHPLEQEQNRLVVARGQRLYSEATGDLRESISARLAFFQIALEGQSPQKIYAQRKKITSYFDYVEQYIDGFDIFEEYVDFAEEEDEELYGTDDQLDYESEDHQ